MAITVKETVQDEFRQKINLTLTNLENVNEVNEQIIRDSQYDIDIGLSELLEEGRLTQEQYNEQMPQLQDELAARLSAREVIVNKSRRLNGILEKGSTNSVVIEQNTGRDEIKAYLNIINSKLEGDIDQKKRIFLESMKETLDAAKNSIDEGRAFDDLVIPVMEREQKYFDEIKILATIELSTDIRATVSNVNETVQSSDLFSAKEKRIFRELAEHIVQIDGSKLKDQTKITLMTTLVDRTVDKFLPGRVSVAFKNMLSAVRRAFHAAEANPQVSAQVETLMKIKDKINEVREPEGPDEADTNTPEM